MSVIREYNVANGYKIMCERYNSAAEVVNDAKARKITNSRFDDMTVNLGGFGRVSAYRREAESRNQGERAGECKARQLPK